MCVGLFVCIGGGRGGLVNVYVLKKKSNDNMQIHINFREQQDSCYHSLKKTPLKHAIFQRTPSPVHS